MAYPCAVPGINLGDYSTRLPRAGWPAACGGTYGRVAINDAGAAVTVDVAIAELVGLIMRRNQADGYAYRPGDTGAYNCRKIAGTNTWSLHAYGLAIDENWSTNPYTSPLKTDKPAWLVQRWNRYGFAWGGHYSGSKDAMHFEFMGTPAQAAAATVLARAELPGGGGGGGTHGPADPNDEILTFGDTGPAVVALQETLNRWYPKLTQLDADGDFGQATFDRVVYFQQAAKLTADGEVGPASREVLGLKVPSAYNTPTPPAPTFVAGADMERTYNRQSQEIKDLLGPMTTSERSLGRGAVAGFKYGALYWTPEYGTKVIRGGIYNLYASLGWEQSSLGYPVTHEVAFEHEDWDGTKRAKAATLFERGSIVWDLESGIPAVFKP
jgi:peptidoglycan hydrolase-like protein with peptidoglycan-binding domain